MNTITMKNLHLATEQEVFDQVAKHLLTQLKKSSHMDYGCRYRLELGDGTILKCAVGCLIADNEYSYIIEGEIYGSEHFREFFGFGCKSPHLNLLRRLQYLHDNTSADLWNIGLKHIALDFNLNADILKEFN